MRLPRASGVLLHPTSLPGPFGSGDLGQAAYHFIDWLALAGQKIWQVLPLGGIGEGNSPYMSSSAFAGNPLLIDLEQLRDEGLLDADDLLPDPRFSPLRVDFDAVVPWRMQRLVRAAQAFFKTAGIEQRQVYRRFCEQQAAWLPEYALFMSLAQAHAGRPWNQWGRALASREADALERARDQYAKDIDFWTFCQWCFFRQWQRLHAYAQAKGVRILGDAPIFVAYQSADVWARQHLFELDALGQPTVVAGVPPDYFSATGQRWGNPLYRWFAHRAEGYAWWTLRIARSFDLVDLLRIDHFRGLAAYWEIPASEPTAMVGRWAPGPGAELFEAVDKTLGPLPIIAEDLGLITPDVDALRRRLDLPGMRVLQFAFGSDDRNPYLPHNHEANAVVYIGTHDNNTALGWWAELGESERAHVRNYLGCNGEDMHWTLLRAACASVADTAIYPMQDLLGLDAEHRMNQPGQAQGNWAWRFALEQVQPEHASRLRELCRAFGQP